MEYEDKVLDSMVNQEEDAEEGTTEEVVDQEETEAGLHLWEENTEILPQVHRRELPASWIARY